MIRLRWLLEKIKSLLSDDSRKNIDIMIIEETGRTLEEILCDLAMNNTDNDYILTEKSKVKQKLIWFCVAAALVVGATGIFNIVVEVASQL